MSAADGDGRVFRLADEAVERWTAWSADRTGADRPAGV